MSVIPTGVDLDFFAWQAPSSQPQVMFIGSMDWPANQDGIQFFMDEVWPRVLRQVPVATMKVIGRTPPPWLVSRAPKGWQFTGFVDDVRPHVAGSAVSVIPLRVGGGTRIKAYEAMALGIPVVSTTIGVEGLPVTDGEHYLRADGAEEFADAIVRLLSDAALRDTLSRRARVARGVAGSRIARSHGYSRPSAPPLPGVRIRLIRNRTRTAAVRVGGCAKMARSNASRSRVAVRSPSDEDATRLPASQCSPALSRPRSLVASGPRRPWRRQQRPRCRPRQPLCRAVLPSAPTGAMSFRDRCAQPGVVKCVGFDTPADFNIGAGGKAGAYGQNHGIYPPSGTTDYTRAAMDTEVKASGKGSLRFTVPSNTGADSSGSWFTNFSTDLSDPVRREQRVLRPVAPALQPGVPDEQVHERRRLEARHHRHWRQAGHALPLLHGAGDRDAGGDQTRLSDHVQLVHRFCIPRAYDGFDERFGSSDFKLQNGRPAPYCLSSQSSTWYFPPVGNCFGYLPGEWFTYQIHVKIGPRVGDEFTNSYVTLWGARQGQPSELIIQWGPYNLTAGSADKRSALRQDLAAALQHRQGSDAGAPDRLHLVRRIDHLPQQDRGPAEGCGLRVGIACNGGAAGDAARRGECGATPCAKSGRSETAGTCAPARCRSSRSPRRGSCRGASRTCAGSGRSGYRRSRPCSRAAAGRWSALPRSRPDSPAG